MPTNHFVSNIYKNLNNINKIKSLNEALGLSNWYYTPPTDPEQMIYDFYFMTMVGSGKNLEDQINARIWGSTATAGQFGGYYNDEQMLELSVATQDAYDKVMKNTYNDVLDATYFSVACELRHMLEKTNIKDILTKINDENAGYAKEVANWYKTFKSTMDADLSVDQMIQSYLPQEHPLKRLAVRADVYKPRGSKKTTSEAFGSSSDRIASYAAAKKAWKGNDLGFFDFAQWAFCNLKWRMSYGGPKWAAIANGGYKLVVASDKEGLEKMIWIDYIFDLEHNTGAALNKVKRYSKDGGYEWISHALDFKRYSKMPLIDFLDKISPSMKYLADRITYALTGLAQDNPLRKQLEDEAKKMIIPTTHKKSFPNVCRGETAKEAEEGTIKVPKPTKTSSKPKPSGIPLSSTDLQDLVIGDEIVTSTGIKGKIDRTFSNGKIIKIAVDKDTLPSNLKRIAHVFYDKSANTVISMTSKHGPETYAKPEDWGKLEKPSSITSTGSTDLASNVGKELSTSTGIKCEAKSVVNKGETLPGTFGNGPYTVNDVLLFTVFTEWKSQYEKHSLNKEYKYAMFDITGKLQFIGISSTAPGNLDKVEPLYKVKWIKQGPVASEAIGTLKLEKSADVKDFKYVYIHVGKNYFINKFKTDDAYTWNDVNEWEGPDAGFTIEDENDVYNHWSKTNIKKVKPLTQNEFDKIIKNNIAPENIEKFLDMSPTTSNGKTYTHIYAHTKDGYYFINKFNVHEHYVWTGVNWIHHDVGFNIENLKNAKKVWPKAIEMILLTQEEVDHIDNNNIPPNKIKDLKKEESTVSDFKYVYAVPNKNIDEQYINQFNINKYWKWNYVHKSWDGPNKGLTIKNIDDVFNHWINAQNVKGLTQDEFDYIIKNNIHSADIKNLSLPPTTKSDEFKEVKPTPLAVTAIDSGKISSDTPTVNAITSTYGAFTNLLSKFHPKPVKHTGPAGKSGVDTLVINTGKYASLKGRTQYSGYLKIKNTGTGKNSLYYDKTQIPHASKLLIPTNKASQYVGPVNDKAVVDQLRFNQKSNMIIIEYGVISNAVIGPKIYLKGPVVLVNCVLDGCTLGDNFFLQGRMSGCKIISVFDKDLVDNKSWFFDVTDNVDNQKQVIYNAAKSGQHLTWQAPSAPGIKYSAM